MNRKASVRQNQRLTQSQRIGLTPALRTALGMLRLNGFELEEMLLREAAENPVLQVSFPRRSGGEAFEVALRTVAARPSLFTLVTDQLGAMRLADDVYEAALIILAELEPDGMLATSLSEISAETGASLQLLEAGLTAVQSCDPPGIGARNLSECLRLQLCDFGYRKGLAQLAIQQVDLFSRQKWPELIRHLGTDRATIDRLARDIHRLKPRPFQTSDEDHPAFLTPDLILERAANGSLSVRLGSSDRIQVRIDPALVEAAVGTDSEALAEKLAKAEALLRALEFRGTTLLRIGQTLLFRQPGFFADGPGALRPLSRADIAMELGLHPSTVSRAVAGKAMLIDGRLVALSTFFSTALPQGQDETAALAVQHTIRRMIEVESANNPLSDGALCAALHADGVDIARRTVAKYRKCMRIPSSFERRRRAMRKLTAKKPERPGP